MKKILFILSVGLISFVYAQEKTNTENTHRVNEIIMKMSDESKKTAFKNSILSTNNICKKVTNLNFHRIKDKKAYWYANCAGLEYEVYVRNDNTGTTHVTSCTVLYLAGKECYFKK